MDLNGKERIRAEHEKGRAVQLKKWRDSRELWENNPKKCLACAKALLYKQRHNTFCSHSCAASVNNKGVDRHKTPQIGCLHCGEKTKIPTNLFCSHQCSTNYRLEETNKKIESGVYVSQRTIRNYLLRTRGTRCQICSSETWMNKPIPVIMDHIDGNSDNNSLENLRLICPNCDAQLPTYKAKNKGKGRAYRRQRYAEGKSF